MAVLTCSLRYSFTHHLAQIVAGFELLARAGTIELRVDPRRSDAPPPDVLEARVDGHVLAYDMIDSAGPASPIAHYPQSVDLYFKRSHDPDRPLAANARPLGLNYGVRAGTEPLRTRALALAGRRRAAPLNALPRVQDFESVPHRPPGPPRIVFLTRVWDPLGEFDESGFVPEIHGPPRIAFNDSRAECIRALRAAFGPSFVGGLVRSDHACERYRELVAPDAVTDQGAYLELLRAADIGVATVGLRGSNPWKLGEYVAASAAIVTHPLRRSVPGPFAEHANYVTFESPEECVAAVALLADEPDVLHAMKIENWRYYHRWLRPDMLVLNTLLTAREELA